MEPSSGLNLSLHSSKEQRIILTKYTLKLSIYFFKATVNQISINLGLKLGQVFISKLNKCNTAFNFLFNY